MSRGSDPAEGLRRELAEERQVRGRLERELRAVHDSTSFRLGHALVRGAKRVTGRRSSPARPPTVADPAPTPRAAPATGSPPAAEPAASPPAAEPAASPPAATPARGAPAAPRLRRPGAVLLDATEVSADAARHAAVRLHRDGGPVTLVHPRPVDGLPDDVEVIVADAASDALVARSGPERTYRLLDTDGGPQLLRGVARPLVQVVDDLGTAEGLPPGPVFIGGTGRSGTWVIGRMLSAHPRFLTVHTELRFHSAPPGFGAVLDGSLSPDRYARVVVDKWYGLTGGANNVKGLQLIATNRELQQALEAFRASAERDVPGALGQLVLDLVGPHARGRGALRWAETTPANAAAADALTTALPSCRVIHSIRDGRDVAASVVTMPWGPDEHLAALDWWADRIRRAHAAMARADADRVHTVRLEELVHLDRRATLDRLLSFLDYTDDAGVRDYFEQQMNGQRGNVGRWREELDVDRRDAYQGRYHELLAELADEGVTALPAPPDDVDTLAG